MQYRMLGRTGIKISPYCLGAMMFGAVGNPDHDDSIRIIHKALDAGINLVDTADTYSHGESEEVEELLVERGVEADHVTVHRWVQRFAPLLADAARPCRHLVGDRWQVDETYVKVAGRWRYVECDHGRLKARLRPMRGRKQGRSAMVVVVGPALVPNVRRGRYELAAEELAL